jgi:predicted metal-dependent enzyme (double-stranded beta helix superfamily)
MLDLDDIVDRCVQAVAEPEPRLAIREVLERAVAGSAAASVEPRPGLNFLHRSPELTVIDVIWPPVMTLFPHDHRMWAAIAIYGGQEQNSFFRRDGARIVASGGKELRERDVLLLGDDTIHSVHNPGRNYTGAIHVYGGDFVAQPRSQWDPETLAEEPWDLDAVLSEFTRAEEAARRDA